MFKSLYKPSVNKPLEFFFADLSNPRKNFPEDELLLLGKSLLKGQLVDLIARESGMIIDGHRRVLAANMVGLKTLSTRLVGDDVTDAQVKEIQLITQLSSAQLTPFEVYGGCKEWLKHYPAATAKELAAAIDRSEASVSKLLSLDRCIQPVKDAAAAGKLGLSDWAAIAKVGEAEQLSLLAAKLTGASRDELQRQSRKARNGTVASVLLKRVKIAMPGGMSLVVSGKEISMSELVELLAEVLKEARRAEIFDISTWVKMMADKAGG